MPRPPVLLLGPGRSGSTLTQMILNTSEHLSIWGEHAGFLRTFSQTWETLTEARGLTRNHYVDAPLTHLVEGSLTEFTSKINWANPFTKDDVDENARAFITSMLTKGIDTERVHWGFKEISYDLQHPFMKMWLHLFPETKFVFLVRGSLPVMRSMMIDWWLNRSSETELSALNEEQLNDMISQAAKLWTRAVGAVNTWHANPKINSHLLRFEELEANPKRNIKAMFSFLDLPVPKNAMDPTKRKLSHSRSSPLVPQVTEILEQRQSSLPAELSAAAKAAGYNP